MCSAALLWKLLAASDDRRISPLLVPWVYELRAATDQGLPGAGYGHMGLGVVASVLERVQELRIEACQASEVLKASISSVLRLLWRR